MTSLIPPPSPSSGRFLHVQLSTTELHALELLASSILLSIRLPQSMHDACELLRTHGFARLRFVKEHGQPAVQAYDITDEGQTYLIRIYKNRGAHV